VKSSSEIKQLAYERLSEAEILCNAGKYDGAFYLAGYSVELMLKAKICEHFGIDNLFDERASNIHGVATVRNAVKKHDIRLLFIYSGLITKFRKAKVVDQILMETYGYLIANPGDESLWNEQVRYQPIGSQNKQNVQELIKLLNDDKGLLKWIEQN